MPAGERSADIARNLLSFWHKKQNGQEEIQQTNLTDGVKNCLKILNLKIKNENIQISFDSASEKATGKIAKEHFEKLNI